MVRYQVPISKVCKVLQFNRSSFYYQKQEKASTRRKIITKRLVELAGDRPRFGYERLNLLLKREGVPVARNTVHRYYKAENLQLRQKNKKKRAKHIRHKPTVASAPHDLWTMDFMHDRLGDGRKYRILNVLDICSRKFLGSYIDQSIDGEKVSNFLDELGRKYKLPAMIQVDNGSEFTSKKFDEWAHLNGIQITYIDPGKPTQNGFIESLIARMRDGCLRCSHFISVLDAREQVEAWRNDYNKCRPHPSLNHLIRDEYIQCGAFVEIGENRLG